MSITPPDTAGSQFDRQAEVDRILAEDETLLGRLWAYDREDLTAEEIGAREGTPSFGWVYNYRSLVRVLRDGEIPNSPGLSIQAARRVRAWLKKIDMSPELRAALVQQESLLMSRAEDRQAQSEEVEGAVEATKAAEAAGTPGIYVYTLPHYLRYPYDTETGRTLLKVGHSSVDAHYRAGSQGRLTALPEDPILLRIYPVEESALAERDFHTWLKDADHSASRTRRGGSEWYLTSLRFLDRIARSKGLDIQVITEFEAGDE
ncbi:hypothetical protein J2X11_001678 [Aeromicrobium panaciterrae]|uniref:GIY-YIG nuclease family protein n=1 Tax=Aeromicrobium panaciterrae TaxID=363861 RepID=A0ABU1UNV6_9ACTN|nr:hypothetical protein [Aeromicrobium panaciterrae]MDR7086839.1 hypothetical protein [Aeromicrobium panaciterrae]